MQLKNLLHLRVAILRDVFENKYEVTKSSDHIFFKHHRAGG